MEEIYSQPMFNNLKITVFAFLAATFLSKKFFFALLEVSLFGSERLHCQGTICSWLRGKTVFSAFEQFATCHFIFQGKVLGKGLAYIIS